MSGASYRDIAAELRDQIEAGALPPGSRLPSEYELAVRFAVQRNIIRLAMADLVADGLVVRRPRTGTVVRDRDPVRVPFSVYQSATDDDRDGSLGPWETACAALGIAGSTNVVGVEQVPAAGRIAEYLEVTAGTQLVCRTRHMAIDEAVAMIQRAYMPLARVDGTVLAGPGKVVGGAYAALAAAGIVPATASMWAVARTATVAERETLGLARGVQILETWRVTFDGPRRPIELLHTVANSELVTLVFDHLPLRRDHD